MSVDENHLRSLTSAAVRSAVEEAKRKFQATVEALAARLTRIEKPYQQ